jgi:hypothetical protein
MSHALAGNALLEAEFTQHSGHIGNTLRLRGRKLRESGHGGLSWLTALPAIVRESPTETEAFGRRLRWRLSRNEAPDPAV